MAQWIPKTAWKVSNLNKRYGQQYLLKGYPALENSEPFFGRYTALHDEKALGKTSIREKIVKTLKESDANPFPGALIIDLRDRAERQREPLDSRAVLVLHPHDLLSGAALPLLPEQKARSALFLVASSEQRAASGVEAARRWGYHNVSIMSVAMASDAIKNTG